MIPTPQTLLRAVTPPANAGFVLGLAVGAALAASRRDPWWEWIGYTVALGWACGSVYEIVAERWVEEG